MGTKLWRHVQRYCAQFLAFMVIYGNSVLWVFCLRNRKNPRISNNNFSKFHLRKQTDKFWKSKVSFEKARGDLEIQRFLGIILKKLKMSSVSNKDLLNFQRVVITFYFRHANKRKPRNTTLLPYNYTRQVELHRSKEHSANSICKACSIPDTFRLVTNVDFFSEFYNNTLCACI